MARIQLASLGSGVAQNATGAVVPGAPGTISLHGTSTPVPIYADEIGATNTSGTFTTDSDGRIPGWVTSGAVIDILIPPTPVITTSLPGFVSADQLDGGTPSSSMSGNVDGGSP